VRIEPGVVAAANDAGPDLDWMHERFFALCG